MTIILTEATGETIRCSRVPPAVVEELLQQLPPTVMVEVRPDAPIAREEAREGKPPGWFGLAVALARETWKG